MWWVVLPQYPPSARWLSPFIARPTDFGHTLFKYSDERYDPDEWMFPGSEQVDGTIEGAMRAGMGAYPP